ncbi:peroxiredoxin-like 2C [Gastrophryne carolinensis]
MATDCRAVTQQISRKTGDSGGESGVSLYHPDLELAAGCLLTDSSGRSFPFRELYRDKKALLVFVRNFLCYICKEYVEDLAKIPFCFLQEAGVRLIVIGQSSHLHIQEFCSLTGYNHEMYVDPGREIFSKLGMKRGETSSSSAGSLHVKSNFITGSIKSIWRAMKSPAFDFQGDLAQQGGAIIVGPGNRVHFLHRDKNRYDHVPINALLLHAGVQTMPFGNQRPILEV